MTIQIMRVEHEDVKAMRELYRHEAHCQIIHYSFIGRKLADPYLILIDGHRAGYAAIGNIYPAQRVIEFYTLPNSRAFALPMFQELLTVTGATEIEAQSNMPLALLMLYDCATNIRTESILFEDAFTSALTSPNTTFREATAGDDFTHFPEPYHEHDGWLLEVDGAIVAVGDYLEHYNPPYGDIYMEVIESERRRGYGSYLVQELKRLAYEMGKKPAARCGRDNFASRQTLQKAGLLPCGRLLAGDVISPATAN